MIARLSLPMALLTAALIAVPAGAQKDTAKRSDIVVVGEKGHDDCVGADRDGKRRIKLDCLNQSLSANRATPPRSNTDAAALAGRQPPSRTGTFSYTATAQRMGSNFGKSARPQRPAPPVFAAPNGVHR